MFKNLKYPARVICLLLASIFSSISTYQYWLLKYSGGTAKGFCSTGAVIGCDAAITSFWAAPFNILPVALLGFTLFLILIFLELVKTKKSFDMTGLYFTSAISSFFYLVLLLALPNICMYCLMAHIFNIAAFLFFLSEQKIKRLNIKITIIILFFVPIVSFIIQLASLPVLKKYKKWNYDSFSKVHFEKSNQPILPDDSPKILFGKAKKKISITVATDFTCLHCREHFFELSRVANTLNVSIEANILIFPLERQCNPIGDKFHLGACNAALVGICMWQNNSFDQFFQKVYENTGSTLGQKENLWTFLESNSEKRKQLTECIVSEKTKSILETHVQFGNKNQISGTPTSWYNGIKYEGQMDWFSWTLFLK